jgi:hypothetical protein
MDSPPTLGGLGSLAQSARTKQLKTARAILYFVGGLTIVVNVAFVIFAEPIVNSQIDRELRELQQQNMEIDPGALKEYRQQAIRITRLVNGIAVLIGVVFIVCGALVYTYPVPATITSLVLYIGSAAAYGVIDPTTLARGWLIKLLILIGLFKAVQAAFAYESERKRSAEEAMLAQAPIMPQ